MVANLGVNSGTITSFTGKIAGVAIGGSLLGGSGQHSGMISSQSNLGSVTIADSLVGDRGLDSGEIISGNGKIASVTIGNNVVGGIRDGSGRVFANGILGPVTVTGSVVGGVGNNAGRIETSTGKIASVTIGGSLEGGGTNGATISSGGDLGTVTIGGDVAAGADFTALITSFGNMANVNIGGSLVGTANFTGRIFAIGDIGALAIAGDVIGGSASGNTSLAESGYIGGRSINLLTIGGSIMAGLDNTSGTFTNNGAARVQNNLKEVLITGSMIGNSTNPVIISARGQAVPTATADVAIGKLTVLGHVDHALIMAGYDPSGAGVNADAQIGTVSVGGDWIASGLVAGAVAAADGVFGTADDAKMSGPGVKDVAGLFSSITSLTIGGQALGTAGGTDFYAIMAEHVMAVKIGGQSVILVPGNSNDDQFIGFTGDFKIREI